MIWRALYADTYRKFTYSIFYNILLKDEKEKLTMTDTFIGNLGDISIFKVKIVIAIQQ